MKTQEIYSTDYFKNLYKQQYQDMADEERKALLDLAKIDVHAFNLAWKYNLPLAVKAATDLHTNIGDLFNVDIDDLIQEATLGLRKAIELYNPESGAFSTYAFIWMRQRMYRYIEENEDTIRKPVHFKNKQLAYYKTYRQVINEFSDDSPSKINNKIYEILLKKGTVKNRGEFDFLVMWCYNNKLVSLDMATNDEELDDATIGDFIVDPSVNIEKDVTNDAVSKAVVDKIRVLLSEKELDILLNRAGYYGQKFTLDELGEKYHVTRERIRQIEKKAKEKVKRSFPYFSLTELELN